MRRRDFITAVGGAAVAWPLAARAQHAAMPVIGFLSSGSRDSDEVVRLPSFRQGLKETDYIEGQSVIIEYYGAENRTDRLPTLAKDLARRQVTVIAAVGSPLSALAAKSATTTIPIVFTNASDPVRNGLVASLNRPGGNITGVTSIGTELDAKRLEFLRELAPSVTSIAVLVNPNRPDADEQSTQMQDAASTLGQTLHVLKASNERDFDRAFRTLVQLQIGALVIAPDALFFDRRDQITALATRYSVPSIYEFREFVVAGGLISYGANLSGVYRQIGILAGRILKGEKPADLPVERPTKFDLTINTKTAKALGLTVPASLLATADEVVE